MDNRFIICGDFNAKHATGITNKHTTEQYCTALLVPAEFTSSSVPNQKTKPTDPDKIPDLIHIFGINIISTNYIEGIQSQLGSSSQSVTKSSLMPRVC